MGSTHFANNFYLKELVTNYGYSDLNKWKNFTNLNKINSNFMENN